MNSTQPSNNSFLKTYNLSEGFNYVINDNYYIFSVSIATFDGRLKVLNPQSIKKLVIEDDLTTPFHKGFVVLDNSFDNLEQTKLEESNQQNRGFILKGDSRDVLKIQIMPKLTEGADTIDEESLKYFLLDFEFIIYHEEDSAGKNISDKTKTLHFWDIHYEILKEKDSYFSTANINSDNSEPQTQGQVYDLSNSQRSLKTGIAIKELLRQSLNQEENLNITFSDDFNEGATSIFFSAPAKYKAIDSLNYLVSLQVSDGAAYEPSILRLERYPKEFSLISLSDYFVNAVRKTGDGMAPGRYYLEDYRLAGYADGQTQSNYAVLNNYSPKFAPYFRTLGNIISYSFDNMPGDHSQDEIIPTAVHYYSYTDKMFEIDYEQNSSKETFKRIIAYFCTPFNSNYANIIPGEFRDKNKNIKHIFYPLESTPEQRLSIGRSNVIYDYVMNSNVVIFRVYGSTHRQAGRFISISRDTNLPQSDFDSKLLGVYFIVNVKHVFENATYFNDLVCVKTYANNNIFLTSNTL